MLFLDYETRGLANLPLCGQYEYLPTSEILMVGLAHGDEAPYIAPRVGDTPGPFVSWGRFDYHVYKHHEDRGVKSEEWIDAMALAYYIGFPAGLNGFCSAIGVENKKDPRGTRLIHKYCIPVDGEFLPLEDNPEDQEAFIAYCLQDVVLLQKAWSALAPIHAEWEEMQRANLEVTERMNDRGVPIDRPSVIRSLKEIDEQERVFKEEFRELCGYNPTQTEKVRVFLDVPNMQRATLEAAEFDDPVKTRVRDIRLAVSKAAVKKLKPMLALSDTDGRARGCFINNGAHTGRGSSRAIQFQNMKRKSINPSFFEFLADPECVIDDALTGAQENIRGYIQATPGKVLAVADYGQVEARILAWIAESEKLLAAFSDPELDVYKMFAAKLYGVKDWREISGERRQLGKLGVLGSGYGVSGPGLARQAPGYGVELDDAAGWQLVSAFRNTFPEVPNLWRDLDSGVRDLVLGWSSSRVLGRAEYVLDGNFLTCTLPTGRVVRYYKPRIQTDEATGRDSLTYLSRVGYNMTRKRIWGGHFTENLCQAIATDIKLHAMKQLDARGFKLIAEVHDEVIIELPRKHAEVELEGILDIMCEVPGWMEPGLIVADGFLADRYTK